MKCVDMMSIHRQVCSLVAIGMLSPHYIDLTGVTHDQSCRSGESEGSILNLLTKSATLMAM